MTTAVVVPLGTRCITTEFCCAHGLSNRSLPFDWIVTDLNTVGTLIKNRFTDFLRLEDVPLKYLSLPPPYADIRLTNKYGQLFPHLFNHSQSISSQVVKVIEKMNRRCVRFLELLAGDEPILFLLCYSGKDCNELKLTQLQSLLETRYPRLRFHLTALVDDGSNPRVTRGQKFSCHRGCYPLEYPQKFTPETHSYLLRALEEDARKLGVQLPRGHKRRAFVDSE